MYWLSFRWPGHPYERTDPVVRGGARKFTGSKCSGPGHHLHHVPCLKAWADTLGAIRFPMLSDFWPHGTVALQYGVLSRGGFSERAMFVIDNNGIIRYMDIHAIDDRPVTKFCLIEIKKLRGLCGGSNRSIVLNLPWRYCNVLHKMVPRLPPCPPLVE